VTPALNRFLVRLGRWPRRIAVAVCLVLAASSAIDGHSREPREPVSAAADPLAALRDGQLAVPVTLKQGGIDGVIKVGDHIGLLTADVVVADKLLVLRVAGAATNSDSTASILVAADRATALRIARSAGQDVLAVVDKSP
jgi:hypothetical protein